MSPVAQETNWLITRDWNQRNLGEFQSKTCTSPTFSMVVCFNHFTGKLHPGVSLRPPCLGLFQARSEDRLGHSLGTPNSPPAVPFNNPWSYDGGPLSHLCRTLNRMQKVTGASPASHTVTPQPRPGGSLQVPSLSLWLLGIGMKRDPERVNLRPFRAGWVSLDRWFLTSHGSWALGELNKCYWPSPQKMHIVTYTRFQIHHLHTQYCMWCQAPLGLKLRLFLVYLLLRTIREPWDPKRGIASELLAKSSTGETAGGLQRNQFTAKESTRQPRYPAIRTSAQLGVGLRNSGPVFLDQELDQTLGSIMVSWG